MLHKICRTTLSCCVFLVASVTYVTYLGLTATFSLSGQHSVRSVANAAVVSEGAVVTSAETGTETNTKQVDGEKVADKNTTGTFTTKEDAARMHTSDVSLGCKDAPHTIIEYSSMTCPYCVQFHQNVFPEIKRKLIDTCKVKYVYRDFPNSQASVVAGALAHCLTNTSLVTGEQVKAEAIDRYYELVDKLMASNRSWSMTTDVVSALKNTVSLIGADKDKVDKCLGRTDIMEKIGSRVMSSSKLLDVKYMPTLVIDGQVLVGYKSYDEVVAVIDGQKKA